jgi:Ca2+-binding EF-hand superfamily protein
VAGAVYEKGSLRVPEGLIMNASPCGGRLAAVFVLPFVLAITAGNGDGQQKYKSKYGSSDAYELGQMRLIFDSWDLNRDGYVDRKELAKAFRGPGAKPYSGTAPVLKVADRYPDHAMMFQLDLNKDGKISSDEFEEWAKSYLQQKRKIQSSQRRLSQKQNQLATTTNSSEKKQLTAEIEYEKQYLENLKKEFGYSSAFEKHLSRRKIR